MGNVILATADSHAALVYPLRQMTIFKVFSLFTSLDFDSVKVYNKRIPYKFLSKQTVNWDIICS